MPGEVGVGAMARGTGVAPRFLGSRSGVSVARLPSPLEEGEATEAVTGVLEGSPWKPFVASPLKGSCVFKPTVYKEGQSLGAGLCLLPGG